MGFFGSGDKTTTSLDNRVGASDDAIVLQSGAFLFNPGRSLDNKTASAGDEKINWPLIISAVGVALSLLVLFNSKK